MAGKSDAVETISTRTARLLLLDAQGLLCNPRRKADEAALDSLINQLGFVQIDSINVIQRAHHLTLGSRLDGYSPHLLTSLLEHRQTLFEHWTHDASAIPRAYFPFWKHRFRRYTQRAFRSAWWKQRMGANPAKTIAQVRKRIEREGPLQSRHFADTRSNGETKWWGWKPQKVALEHLWRAGELAILRRENFQKVYDLTERVFPDEHADDEPDEPAHLDWACRTALQRLNVATPKELADFWHAVTAAEARTWCELAEQRGEIVPVEIAANSSKPRRSYAWANWREQLEAAPPPPRRARLLCPFDPVLRDRERALRLFGFDYRFEAFVPAAKRVYGYYVLPILDGQSLIGRLDAQHDRKAQCLAVRALWIEPKVTLSAARKQRIEAAVARLARQIGVAHWQMPPWRDVRRG